MPAGYKYEAIKTHNTMFRSIKTTITLSLLAVALLIALPLGVGSYGTYGEGGWKK